MKARGFLQAETFLLLKVQVQTCHMCEGSWGSSSALQVVSASAESEPSGRRTTAYADDLHLSPPSPPQTSGRKVRGETGPPEEP